MPSPALQGGDGGRVQSLVMKRVGRWVFNGITVLSLLVCAATIEEWVASYRVSVRLETSDQWWIDSSRGMLKLVVLPGPPGSVNAATDWVPFAHAFLYPRFQIPHWMVVGVTGILPLYWPVVFYRRKKMKGRMEGGLCLACGYDLRATPGRCPECGAIP